MSTNTGSYSWAMSFSVPDNEDLLLLFLLQRFQALKHWVPEDSCVSIITQSVADDRWVQSHNAQAISSSWGISVANQCGDKCSLAASQIREPEDHPP